MIRIIGIDPGVQFAGWGIIECNANRRKYIACGEIKATKETDIGEKFLNIYNQLINAIDRFKPDEAAIENIFVNKNSKDTIRLGQACGVALLAPAMREIKIAEYAPNTIKKTITGNGHAHKKQISLMVKHCLPQCDSESEHAHDALAIALTHARHRNNIPLQIHEAYDWYTQKADRLYS